MTLSLLIQEENICVMCIKPDFISCKSYRTKNIFFLNVALWQHVTSGQDREVGEATSVFH